jgi:hypothetical protein
MVGLNAPIPTDLSQLWIALISAQYHLWRIYGNGSHHPNDDPEGNVHFVSLEGVLFVESTSVSVTSFRYSLAILFLLSLDTGGL